MPPKKKRNVKVNKTVTKKNNVSDEEIEEEPVSQEQSLYDILEKKNFSENLFTIKGRPMVFYIAPCEPKNQISNLIVKGGGLVQKFPKDGIITLVEIKSDLPAKIPKECYSINYITDSIQANKRVEIKKYSVKLNKKAVKRDSFASPRTRIIFTKEDDKKLVDFVNNHGEYTPSGSKLWQLAEEELEGGHTWQSMRSRYLKVVRKLNFNSEDDGEGEEDFNGDHIDEDKDDRGNDHSQSNKKRKNDRRDDNNHVKKKSKKDDTDEGESSDDLNETSNKSKAKLQAEESFIEADYLDHIQNNDDEDEEDDDVDDILTQEISKPRTNIHSKKSDNNNNKNNNKKTNNNDDDSNDNDNESDENVNDKSYVKEIVLSVINNLMLTTKLPKSVVVHGLIVNNGVVSDTIQYLNNPQEFYHSRSKSAQIWTYTEDKILLDKHERGLEDLANTRGPKSIQNRQFFLES